ncbi:MAG: hypothetical protein GOMPHAMPRED_004443 [Gomphillus americanus]|uniref:Nucleolar pre-ribosomal-associated protein 1 n=1 Tax=Gomphillus americanus TaxID=1940652 RepID=A0A8H3ITU4_9LECA|nr:MAG: hypothetical protein GOMPHAMPRED_004443 [Gomphillus americanus]
MGKRTPPTDDGADIAPVSKRKKLDDKQPLESNNISINTTSDIKKLLVFDQNDITQYRLSLQAFRKYLEQPGFKKTAGAPGDGVLLDYLTNATITTSGDHVENLPDIFQAWRYAVQVHDDGLMVAIPGVLATLLHMISSSLEFVEIGVQICKTVIRKENSSVLQKSLNSPRVRDATIARCLDLLTQVVSFDGGACARNVWLHRSVTMQRLPQLLGMSKKTIYGPTEPASIRDHAITFFLTNLRYQDQEAKAEILSARKITQVLLREASSEKPRIIKEILSTLETYVLKDDNLPKSAKGHVLTDANLGFILGIMRHNHEDSEWVALHELVESFLMESCTSRTHGIVYKQYGWYPPGTEDLTLKEETLFLSGYLTVAESSKYRDRVPVRNTTLAAFIQDLKPWSSIPERRLILGIFGAAPELIADYFLRKKTFSFEPKLTATWIGWATFIYSVLRLSVTNYDAYLDGRVRAPPPVPVIMQSILPQSLTQQSLTKALKHKSELVQLFTLRILVASLEKLQMILNFFQSPASPTAWKATATQILKELDMRLPQYKQILNLYQSCSKEKRILREILSSLLALYNNVMAHLVMAEKLDISSQITGMLGQVAEEIDDCDASTFMELEHLLEIGNCAVEAKWWQKSGNATITSITTILQLLASSRLGGNTRLKSLVRSILEEGYVLASLEAVDSLEALVLALRTINSADALDILQYLDDCLLRLNRKPIKYHGDVSDLVEGGSDKVTVSPLFIVLLEQWPFFLKGHGEGLNTTCAEWICAYLVEAAHAGESFAPLQTLCDRFLESTADARLHQLFQDCRSRLIEAQTRQKAGTSTVIAVSEDDDQTDILKQTEATRKILDTRLGLTKETENHPALTKWSKKDISDAILDSDISNLINCLGSTYPEIRIQAVSALRNFMSKVQNSKYDERQSIYLLIGSLLETIQNNNPQNPLPSLTLSLAARCTLILSNPLHTMYTKANHFLTRSPTWDLSKLSSYWTSQIFHTPPTHADAHWLEVEWLLDTLLDGLRNPNDVNLYRRTGVFERLITNCTSTFAPRSCFERMIDVLYRCVLIGGGGGGGGGATMLVTRFGVLAWIATQKKTKTKTKKKKTKDSGCGLLLSALEEKIRLECDQVYLRKWAGRSGGDAPWL